MVAKVAAGMFTGLLWYLTLGYLDAVRTLDVMVMTGMGPHWGALLGALALSGLAVWILAARGVHFRGAVVAGLVLGLLLGVLEAGDIPLDAAATDGWAVLTIPGVFARGFNSVAVWTALGLAVALTTLAVRRPARTQAPRSRSRPST